MDRNLHKTGSVKMSGEWDFIITTPEKQAELRKAQETGGRASFLRAVAQGEADGTVRKQHYKNLIPTVSRAQMTKALCGEIASKNEIQISHAELGTSTVPPSNSDTGLIAPAAATRKGIGSMASNSNEANFTAYWSPTEATGTWREFALFINGTGSSNSGTLFNRVSINITVGASDALTIDGTVTIT
jgi:hypothetical protein